MYQKSVAINTWDKLPFWEFEEYIKGLNERNKEENKREKEEKEGMDSKMPNFSNMQNSFKTPSFSSPNFGNYLK
jgi:hypothetical protein